MYSDSINKSLGASKTTLKDFNLEFWFISSLKFGLVYIHFPQKHLSKLNVFTTSSVYQYLELEKWITSNSIVFYIIKKCFTSPSYIACDIHSNRKLKYKILASLPILTFIPTLHINYTYSFSYTELIIILHSVRQLYKYVWCMVLSKICYRYEIVFQKENINIIHIT